MSEYPTRPWPEPVSSPPPPELEPSYEPIHPGSGRRSWRERAKRFGGPLLAGLILLATKLKAVLLILPKIKILSTSATMLVSIAAYALIWGWQFAVGLVLLLLVHEMGHVFQLRREGIEASAPMFIPFLGAVVAAKSLGDDAAAEARVGLAGPILGTIGTLVPLAIWLATGEEFWQALTYVGFFINLFNLILIVPFDGGRAMAALFLWMWFVGFGLLVAFTFAFPNPIMVLFLLLGGFESWRRFKNRHTPESRAFHAVSGRTRALVAIVYIGLAALLAVGVSESFLEKDFDDV